MNKREAKKIAKEMLRSQVDRIKGSDDVWLYPEKDMKRICEALDDITKNF